MSAALVHRGRGYSRGFYRRNRPARLVPGINHTEIGETTVQSSTPVLEEDLLSRELAKLSVLKSAVDQRQLLMIDKLLVVDVAHPQYMRGKESYKQAGDDLKLHNKIHNKKVLQEILHDFDMSKDVKRKSLFAGGSKFSLNHAGSDYEYSKVPKSIKKAVEVVLSKNDFLELPVDDFLNIIKRNILKSKNEASLWQKIKSWFKRSSKTKQLYSELENMGADSAKQVVNTKLCSGVDQDQIAAYREEFRANKDKFESAKAVYAVKRKVFKDAEANYKSEKNQYEDTNKQYLEQEALCIAYNTFCGFLAPPSLFETAGIDSTSWQYRLLVDAGLNSGGWQWKMLHEASQDESSWQWMMLDKAGQDESSWQWMMLHEASQDENSWQWMMLHEASQDGNSWQRELLSKAASDVNSDEFKVMSEFNKDPNLYNQLVSSIASTHEYWSHRSNSSGTFEHVGFMFRNVYNKEGKDKKRYSNASKSPLSVVPMFKSSSIEGARSIGLYYDEFRVDYSGKVCRKRDGSHVRTHEALAVFDPQSKQENKELLDRQGQPEDDRKKRYGAHGTSGDSALSMLSTTPHPGEINSYGRAFYQVKIPNNPRDTSLVSLFLCVLKSRAFVTTSTYSKSAARAAGQNSQPVVLFYANKFTTNRKSYANLKNGGAFLLHECNRDQQRLIPKMIIDQA